MLIKFKGTIEGYNIALKKLYELEKNSEKKEEIKKEIEAIKTLLPLLGNMQVI
jgi:hypothetical protein